MNDTQTMPEPQIEETVKTEPKKPTKKKVTRKRTTKKKAAPKKQTKRKRKPAVKKTGRPPGSTTEKKQESVGILTRCKKCQSTERTKYEKPRTSQICGFDGDGKPYNQVTWRNTRCTNCGQARIDKAFEYVPESSK